MKLTEKTTIYLSYHVKKYLQHKAVSESRSLSEIINDKFAQMLYEDAKSSETLTNDYKLDEGFGAAKELRKGERSFYES